MTSQSFQQYIRILLYNLLAALASYGITTPDSTKTLIFSVVGIMGNLAWTMYGTRLNGLLEQVKEKTGVQSIEIKVDPDLISPTAVNVATSQDIVAKPIGDTQ